MKGLHGGGITLTEDKLIWLLQVIPKIVERVNSSGKRLVLSRLPNYSKGETVIDVAGEEVRSILRELEIDPDEFYRVYYRTIELYLYISSGKTEYKVSKSQAVDIIKNTSWDISKIISLDEKEKLGTESREPYPTQELEIVRRHINEIASIFSNLLHYMIEE